MKTWLIILQHLKIPYLQRSSGVIYLRCGFHSERTPSLCLRPGTYKCYGCLRSGTTEDFIQHFVDPLNHGIIHTSENLEGQLSFDFMAKPDSATE